MIEPMTPGADRVGRLAPRRADDRPVGDPVSVLLSAEAREHVTVCLSGEGGDEVFVGYDRFIASKVEPDALRRMPGCAAPRASSSRRSAACPTRSRRRAPSTAAGASSRARARARRRRPHALAVLLVAGAGPGALPSRVPARAFAAIRFEPIRRPSGARDWPATARPRGCYVDLRLTMPDSVLMKVDKMSMAHALEVRVPFLDHALVEFVADASPASASSPASGRKAHLPEGHGGRPAGLRPEPRQAGLQPARSRTGSGRS